MERRPNCCQSLKKTGWSGVGGSVRWGVRARALWESWPLLHRSRSLFTSWSFCVCDLKACHLLLPPMLSTTSFFSVLRGPVDSYPRPMAPLLLFVICHCVLQALPQYFSLLPPPILGECGIQGWVTFRDWCRVSHRSMVTGLVCGRLPTLRSKSSLIG